MPSYYDAVAPGYDELHEQEQLKKLRLIESAVPELRRPGIRVLDVGCGTGLATAFFNCATGVDQSDCMLKVARARYPELKFVQASAESLPFGNDSFDAVLSLTAVQNFSDAERGLREIRRVGRSLFVLSFFKRATRAVELEQLIKSLFNVITKLEEMHDLIFVCRK